MSDLEIYMIIDGSGSMSGVKKDVVVGVNKFIDEQQDDAKANGEDVIFTLTAFDDQVAEIYDAEDIGLVNPVTDRDTFRGGSTALLDAIGRTLTKAPDNNTRKLVVVYTDGHENASREYKTDQIKEMIGKLQATNLWTFVYMSAELEDFAQPANLGFTPGNTVTGTSRGTTPDQFSRLSQGASYYKTGMSSNSSHFYADTAGASDITIDSLGGTIGSDDVTPKLWVPDEGKIGKIQIANSDPGDESDAKNEE